MENAKLNFHMSTMGGGKTLEIILDNHRKARANFSTLIAKPFVDKKAAESIETRFGKIRRGADILIGDGDDVSELISKKIEQRQREMAQVALNLTAGPSWIVYIDEAQFLSHQHVEQLRRNVVDTDLATVEAYGLVTDFRGQLFPGSEALLRLADKRQQIDSWCENIDCGRQAVYNARMIDGKITLEGESVMIDGIEAEYKALCSKDFHGGIDNV